MTAGLLLRELSSATGDRQSAKWILAHVLARHPGALSAVLVDEVAPEVVDEARVLAGRCASGEPLQYVLGSWGFRTVDLDLDRRVLIPRPETEQVAGLALERLSSAPPATRAPVLVDLGTGSGAIALSLAAEVQGPLEVWATDVSTDALELAAHNLDLLASSGRRWTAQVNLVRGDWYDALPDHLLGGVSVIVSNPPYVRADEWEQLDPLVRGHEPMGALVAGPEGTEAIAAVVDGAPQWLVPGGWLVVEIGAGQGQQVAALAEAAGLAEVAVRRDWSDRDRALVARWQGP